MARTERQPDAALATEAAPGTSPHGLLAWWARLPQYRRLIVGAWGVAAVVMAGVGAIIAHNAWVDYEQSRDGAARDVAYVASMLGEFTSRSYADVLHAMETVERDFLVRSAVPMPLVRQRLQTAVASKVATLPQIAAMTVFDRESRPMAHGGAFGPMETRAEVSQALRAMASGSARIVMLPPTHVRADGHRWLPVAMRLSLQDGRFGGAVVAFIDPLHYASYQTRLAARFPGTRTAVLVGGDVLAASPGGVPPEAVLAGPESKQPVSFEAGRLPEIVSVTGVDGGDWTAVYQPLTAAGFAVAVGGPEADVLADWAARRMPDFVAGGLSLLVLLGFTYIATRQIARRFSAESARNAARSQMLEALRSMRDGFALYDVGDRLVLSNERFRRLFGDRQDEVVVGASAEALRRAAAEGTPPDGPPGSVPLPVRPLAEGARCGAGGKIVQLADGRWIRLTEQHTADGGTVALYTDITELKTREAEAYEAKEQAEAASRAKTEFLAIVSHELRTPLNAVIGFSELIKDETFGPVGHERYSEYAEAINGSGIHLLNLINDILDISKIESGKFELYEESIEVGRVAASVAELVQPKAREKSVSLSCDIAGGLPYLYADERALKQILLNLASNAVKFTPEGGRVIVAASLDDAGRVVVRVRDTGIGIKAVDIPRVLEPFGQVESAFSRTYEGTGLGLPLSSRLAALHGGELCIDSTPGEGTTVSILFPAERTVEGATRALRGSASMA